MSKNNLRVINTGLDHCYINGVPIVEAEIDINDVFKKVARLSSLAVHGDPVFSQLTEEQKNFNELHGEGDRITKDFLEEGARELLPMFIPYQRWMPEGVYDAKPYEDEYLNNTANSTWNNPHPTNLFIDSVKIRSTSGFGDVTFIVDGVTLGTVHLPISDVVSEYLAYDLAGWLGGVFTVINYDHTENIRNNNIAQEIQLVVSNASVDFSFDYKVCGSQYNAIGWAKALADSEDVRLPAIADNIRISYLIDEFSWSNVSGLKVIGVTLKHNSGSADVIIRYNETDGTQRLLDRNTVGDDYSDVTVDIDSISIILDNKTDDFSYDLIINTLVPKTLPSPRFEFDSLWNPGKIIYRYQNMDNRMESDKLNYTSETIGNIRIDTNIFDEVHKYIFDSLKNYVLKELYEATGYDKKAIEYKMKYERSRTQAKFWLRSEKGLQTGYNYAGV